MAPKLVIVKQNTFFASQFGVLAQLLEKYSKIRSIYLDILDKSMLSRSQTTKENL